MVPAFARVRTNNARKIKGSLQEASRELWGQGGMAPENSFFLPDLYFVATLFGLFPDEFAIFANKAIGHLVERAFIGRFKTSGNRIDGSVSTSVEAVAVRRAAGHGPVDAAAKIASVHASGK